MEFSSSYKHAANSADGTHRGGPGKPNKPSLHPKLDARLGNGDEFLGETTQHYASHRHEDWHGFVLPGSDGEENQGIVFD